MCTSQHTHTHTHTHTVQLISIVYPNSASLTVIKYWKNKKLGVTGKFKLKSSVVHKWREIGNFVVPWQQLEVWTKEKDAEACCDSVFSYWLENSFHDYPTTWKGLYDLLDDSELGQTATELKCAVENAII